MTCGGKPFWSVAILCASVFFIILQSCPPGRNHVLFTLLCPRLLRVLFYSRPSGLLNPAVQSWEASQHLSWSWGRSRLELLSWFSVEGADCSPPVNYCTHWEAPCGSISDEWESCQSNAARLGPWGIYEAILFLSIWKAYCDQSAGCGMRGWNPKKLFSFSLHIRNVPQDHTRQFDSSWLTKAYFSFPPRKRRNFKWKV